MTRRGLLFIVLASLAIPAAGQDRATVFVHGLASSSATWDQTVAAITPQLSIRPLQANLAWQAPYEAQAGELEGELGADVPADGVAIGHSNGGVVSRQWSRNRSLGALVTLGSPNQGAPIADHVFDWLGFLDDVLWRIANVNNIFAHDVNIDAWWWVPSEWAQRFAFASDIWNTAGNGLFSLGVDYRLPILPEMRVSSAYMASLNSGANNDREAAGIPGRVAIVNVARDFYDGGPFRLLSPDNYEDWHVAINITGISLDVLASIIRITADVQDRAAFDLADQIGTVGEWFLEFEEVWCRSVSDPSPLYLGRCYEHDGIVPAWSQAYDYPRLPLIIGTDGPVHTQETSESGAQVYQALTAFAHIPARPAPEDPPPPAPTDPQPPTPPTTPTSPQPPTPPATPTDPPPTTPQPPTGRYKLNGAVCYWDAYDSGPDQCTPLPPPGRYKFDGAGACYWEPNDYPPDQCSPPVAHTGRFKLDNGSCYWDPNDDGPNQCTP